MPVEMVATEADQFVAAVAGLEIDYVRTDRGYGPCRTLVAGAPHARVTVGTMGFSAMATTEMPADTTVLALITQAPSGGLFCGVETKPGQVFAYAPGATFVGREPAGLGVTVLVLEADRLERTADALQTDLRYPRSPRPLPSSPMTVRLTKMLHKASTHPEIIEQTWAPDWIVDTATSALAPPDSGRARNRSHRLDSGQIVRDCIEYVEGTGALRPSLSTLCRVALVSESRLRQAFAEVLDVPPTRYFQLRLLSRLRHDLLRAAPDETTVTHVASLLGVTQLGRMAGHYKDVFGELPSTTLRRVA